MIEDFSSGYYRTVMNVHEYDDGPVIDRSVYNFINQRLYEDSTVPVVMRLSLDADETFVVESEGTIPRDVLALPEELIDDGGRSSVFLLKEEHAHMIGRHYG